MSKMIFSIGHSDHPLEKFLNLLRQHEIQAIVDVRSTPFSRHAPQFNKEVIESFLKENNIDYVFLGRELGARRPERSCYVNGRAEYARIAELEVFSDGIQRVSKGAEKYCIALMCTEKDPLFCHRCVLVGRALADTGISVQHIHSDGHLESQNEVEQRMMREVGVQPDLFAGGLDNKALVTRAYQEQGARLAVREESETYETVHDRIHEEEC